MLPPGAVDLGEADAAIELWEHYSGKRLDETQRLAVQVMMAQVDGGRWAAATTGREMPRQNGKGDEVEVVELWGLVQRAEAILHTVHDAVLLASQTQQRMLGILEGHPDLRRLVKRKWQGTGQQMIEMRNGGVIWYRTRTGGGGRGVDRIDRVVVDEAQHATGDHLAAVTPTLMAAPDPQMNALGTSGLAGVSAWWWSVRRRALSPDPGALGYVGHTAEDVKVDADGRVVQERVDANDRGLWAAANPALAAGRGGGLGFLEEQLRRLGPDAFAREHLGVWDAPDDDAATAPVINPDAWQVLAEDEVSARPDPVAFAVDVSPDRAWTTIGLAGRRGDGGTHVQVVESGRGTDWVVARVVDLVARWRPGGVAVDPAGPAGSLIPALEDAKVPVVALTARQRTQACGMLLDGVAAGDLRHSGQPLLNISVGAAVRHGGESWTWGTREPSTDVAPLRAVTWALFALAAVKPVRVRSGVVV